MRIDRFLERAAYWAVVLGVVPLAVNTAGDCGFQLESFCLDPILMVRIPFYGVSDFPSLACFTFVFASLAGVALPFAFGCYSRASLRDSLHASLLKLVALPLTLELGLVLEPPIDTGLARMTFPPAPIFIQFHRQAHWSLVFLGPMALNLVAGWVFAKVFAKPGLPAEPAPAWPYPMNWKPVPDMASLEL